MRGDMDKKQAIKTPFFTRLSILWGRLVHRDVCQKELKEGGKMEPVRDAVEDWRNVEGVFDIPGEENYSIEWCRQAFVCGFVRGVRSRMEAGK